MASEPTAVYRKDYKPTSFLVDTVYLSFNLNDDVTRVYSKMHMVPNYESEEVPELELNGRSDVSLVSVKVGGEEWLKDKYELTPKLLTLKGLPHGDFDLEIEVDIKPQENTMLEGLYQSGGIYITQNEAQGFRGITYFYDRPDVMSKYSVRVEGEKSKLPILLSNGNLAEQGDLEGGRHYALWIDPFPKPCYLFALVAGDLSMHEDFFETMSGKKITLRIYAQQDKIKKVHHAMESLKQAMKWDEEKFGLEYDLDLFNIVATEDFNMGAMENKSLNIFNVTCVLASQETSSDGDFMSVQGIVAHEYFHNWTGDRVTCQDWFQLTLKEGLTVFRDQEFTSDLNSRPVKRISDVRFLRGPQFAEDSGPMSHPIRPDSYIKMDNFYTGTVYRKGAEIIRIYKTMLGGDGFRKGMDLYFKRHDGMAVTCDDFLAAMADANGKDLRSLQKWYGQAGTPQLTVSCTYDESARTLTLKAKQNTPPTAGQPVKIPVLIPICVGLLDKNGQDMPLQVQGGAKIVGTTALLEFDTKEASYVFENVTEKPIPSILRGFSAPVKLTVEGQTEEDLLFLFANDSDEFNRWDAGQTYLKTILINLYNAAASSTSGTVEDRCEAAGGVPEKLIVAFRSVFTDDKIDGAFAALATSFPSASELIQSIGEADPVVLHGVCKYTKQTIAQNLEEELKKVLKDNTADPGEPYAVDQAGINKRSIKNQALAYLSSLKRPEYHEECLKRFREATNMTDSIVAIACLSNSDCPERPTALQEFDEKWKHDKQVMLKWLSVQASSNLPGNLPRVQELLEHPAFNMTTPNCCYALCGGLVQSAVNFHNIDGSGYTFACDLLMKIDAVNPQVSSRLAKTFTKWKLYDKTRQDLMKEELKKMMNTNKLSENSFEVVSKSLE